MVRSMTVDDVCKDRGDLECDKCERKLASRVRAVRILFRRLQSVKVCLLPDEVTLKSSKSVFVEDVNVQTEPVEVAGKWINE
jgi:hypothetical protein